MCDNEKHFEVTFKYFNQKLSEYTNRVVEKLNLSEGEKFIDDFLIQNDLWKIFSNWMSKIFDYIDRFYLKEKKDNLKRICLNTFKVNVKYFNPSSSQKSRKDSTLSQSI